MASDSKLQKEVAKLRSENRRLVNENKNLRNGTGRRRNKDRNIFRSVPVILFASLAVLLLFIGNILFWSGNTIVKTDRYAEAVQPLIKEPEVQAAISNYASQQIFKSVDTEAVIQDALPPRAVFLAPTLSEKVKENTQGTINKVVASPKFADKWNQVQTNAHAKFIDGIKQNGSDGALDINEFYKQINDELKTTKLSFLADKSLPPKVGSIKLVEGNWISKLQTLINNIDTWRTIAIILLLVSSALAIWLSRSKRRTVIKLGLLFSGTMLATLIMIRIAPEVVSAKVDDQYSAAAATVTETILHPLQTQTRTILAFGLLIALIAWITGNSRSASFITSRIQLVFGGKIHGAIFKRENKFTIFMSKNKRVLQWISLALVASLILFIRLTPTVLVVSAVSVILIVLVIEVLAAKRE